jgi:hypothetical protein
LRGGGVYPQFAIVGLMCTDLPYRYRLDSDTKARSSALTYELCLEITRHENSRKPRKGCGSAPQLRPSYRDGPIQLIEQVERTLLKPQIERWIHDQVKHDWPDLWEIQDQTPALKNELLLGRKEAPDMDRRQYVEAMQETIGIGYPEIKAFILTEVDKEADGFQVVGCAKLQREGWRATTVQYIHVKVVDGKVRFGWPDGSAEQCKL